MTIPSTKCQTSWGLYAQREGNDLGSRYTSLMVDWSPTTCDNANGFTKLKDGVDKKFGQAWTALHRVDGHETQR